MADGVWLMARTEWPTNESRLLMAKIANLRPPVESLWVERSANGYTPSALVLWP